MNRNLGHTWLRRKRHSPDPMEAFDSLPAPLRQWLAQARLPWSPVSARRIWAKSAARGRTAEQTIAVLKEAEVRTLARDRATSL